MDTTTLAVIAIVSALALLGLVMVLVTNNLALQEAGARPFTPVRGCDGGGPAFNASQGRCFQG